MFHIPTLLPLLSFFISFTVAFSLPALQILNKAPTATSPLSPANKTLTVSPVHTCTGGRNPGDTISVVSCMNAADRILATLPYSHRETLSFGDRRSAGGRNAMVPLPYISVSSDGECALEIVSNDPSRSDYATILEFTKWALRLVKTCKIGDVEVSGGVAGKLGSDESLGLLLTKFDHSNIVCRKSSKPATEDCEALVDKMPAEDAWRVFGDRGAPGVEVALPYTISERYNCLISISTTGPPDRENWYTVWKYAAAVANLCVFERSAPGAAYGLGIKHGKIDIVMDVRADEDLS